MSRFLSPAEYAEDQQYAHAILAGHVLSRGATVGAGLGGLLGGTFSWIVARRIRAGNTSIPLSEGRVRLPADAASRPLLLRPGFLSGAVVGGGKGVIGGTALMTLALAGRMWGKEEIEWKDRAYRLLHNQGQVAADDGILVGAALGTLVVASSGVQTAKWTLRLGGAGLGAFAGMLGVGMWRNFGGPKGEKKL